MPVYTWKGKTRQGTVTAGVMEAANEETVMTQLRGQMLTPIKVKVKAEGHFGIPWFSQADDQNQGARHFHPSVCDDDRCGPAVGSVFEDSR